MANVLFKRGPQANLPEKGSAVDGVFYFTEDTNRLYLGKGTDRVLLNQTVQIVDSLTTLENKASNWNNTEKQDHKDDFYYLTAENILCVWDGSQWKQINPDDDTKVNSMSIATKEESTNVAKATITVGSQNQYNNNTSEVSDTFTITGAGSIKATASGKNITLTGDTYTLTKTAASENSSSSVDLILNRNNTAESTIHLVSTNTNALEFQPTSEGINLIAYDTNLSGSTANVSVTANNGTLQVKVKDSGSNEKTGTASYVGVGLTGASGAADGYLPISTFTSTTSAGAVYSKDAIDSMLGGLDGMTYKGIVSDGVPLPTSGIKNGDTYVVASEDFLPAANTPIESNTADSMTNGIKVGDMFIAKGTEGADGTISSGLEWTYIPAGNDSLSDVTYRAETNTSGENSILLKNGSHSTIAKINLIGGTNIDISSVASGDNNNTLTATIDHETMPAITNTEATETLLPSEALADPSYTGAPTTGGASFAAITGLTISNGHVTAIERGKFVPVTYDLVAPTVTNITKGAQIAVNMKDSNQTAKAASNIKLYSDSISIAAGTDNTQVNMELVWGTF